MKSQSKVTGFLIVAIGLVLSTGYSSAEQPGAVPVAPPPTKTELPANPPAPAEDHTIPTPSRISTITNDIPPSRPEFQPPAALPLTPPPLPEIPQRECKEFKGNIDIMPMMETLLVLSVHFGVFDDAQNQAGKGKYENQNPDLQGANLDGFVAMVDLEAVKNKLGGVFQFAANFMIQNFAKLFPNKGGFDRKDLLELERDASKYRFMCRLQKNENNYRSDQRVQCEEQLAEFRRYKGLKDYSQNKLRSIDGTISRETNEGVKAALQIQREEHFQLDMRINEAYQNSEEALKRSIPRCGLYPNDAHVAQNDMPPPQGCPSRRFSFGSDQERITELMREPHLETNTCNGAGCFTCKLRVGDIDIRQTCKEKEASKTALLLMCDYAHKSYDECLRELEAPSACNATQFVERGSCRLTPSQSETVSSNHSITSGINMFFPAAFYQGVMAGRTSTLNVGYTSTTHLAMHPHGSGGMCSTSNGCQFCDDVAEVNCNISFANFRDNQSGSNFDIAGNGTSGDRSVHNHLNATVKPPSFRHIGGADWAKLRAACHLWREKHKGEIDSLTKDFFRVNPLSMTSDAQCQVDSDCSMNNVAVNPRPSLLNPSQPRRDYMMKCNQGECTAYAGSNLSCTSYRKGESFRHNYFRRIFGENYRAPVLCQGNMVCTDNPIFGGKCETPGIF